MSQFAHDDSAIQLPDLLPHDPAQTFNPGRSIFDFETITGESSAPRTETPPGPLPDNIGTTRRLSPGELGTPRPKGRGTESSGFERSLMEDRLGGRFQMRSVIGRGGFGEVWEAVQASLDRVVAVKALRSERLGMLPLDDGRRDQMLEMFNAEAQIAASLDHPNILPIYDLGSDGGTDPLIAMKLVRGEPWDDLLARDREELPWNEFLDKHLSIFEDVCQAVAFAHSRGVIHRDIKPAQVMVGQYGETLLMDWGLAVIFDRTALIEAHLGHAPTWGTMLESAANPAGTPAFMAPEQTREGSAQLGTWTDVYLLGGTLYLILTDEHPHPGPGRSNAYKQAVTGFVMPVEQAKCDPPPADPDLAAIAMRALSPDPEDRFASVDDFLDALRAWRSGSVRRDESMAIVTAVGREVEGSDGGYRSRTRQLEQLDRALQLWPANDEARALSARVLEVYARRALGNGDLVLARVQAERLGTERRGELLAEVEAKEAEAARKDRLRRVAMNASRGLTLLAVFGGFAAIMALTSLFLRSEEARGVALFRQIQAQEAQLASDRAYNRIVNNAVPILIQYGDTDTNRSMLEEIVADYRRRGVQTLDDKALRTLGLGLRQLGDFARDAGDMERALELYREAREVFGRNVGGPRNWEEIFNGMSTLRRTMDAAAQKGEYQQVYETLLAALPEMEDYVAAHATTEKGWNELAEYYRDICRAARNLGDKDAAQQFLARWAERMADAPPSMRERPSYPFNEAQRHIETAYMAVRLDDEEEASRAYARATDILESLHANAPQNRSYAEQLGRVYTDAGGLLLQRGLGGEALDLFLKAEPFFALDPPDTTDLRAILFWGIYRLRVYECYWMIGDTGALARVVAEDRTVYPTIEQAGRGAAFYESLAIRRLFFEAEAAHFEQDAESAAAKWRESMDRVEELAATGGMEYALRGVWLVSAMRTGDESASVPGLEDEESREHPWLDTARERDAIEQ